MVKNAQGEWNFATLGSGAGAKPPAQRGGTAKAPSGSAPTPSSGSRSSEQQQLSLDELTIQDGQVAITDLQERKGRMAYVHINLELSGFKPGAPFNVEAEVKLPGPGNQQVRLQGIGGPFSNANPMATPFKGALDLKGVGIAGLQQFLQSPALVQTDGHLSGHTTIDSQNGKLSAKGQMLVEKPRMRGIEIGYPISMDYDLSDDVTNNLLRINKGVIKLQSPSFTPDAERMAQMKLKGMMPTADNPLGAASSILAGIQGQKGHPAEGQQQQQQQNPMNQILDILGQKKKQPQMMCGAYARSK